MSFTHAVPTDIMPPNPKPHNARVPSNALKFGGGDTAAPTPPNIAMIMASNVIGRLP